MKSYLLTCSFLALSVTPTSVLAQSPLGLPTTPKTPSSSKIPQVQVPDTSLDLVNSSSISRNSTLDANLIPRIGPFSGTILPTDTLFGQITPDSPAFLPPAQLRRQDKLERFLELDSFLAKHKWHGPRASNWLKEFPVEDARIESTGIEDARSFLPVAWTYAGETGSNKRMPIVLQVNKSCRELRIFNNANQLICDKNKVLTAEAGTVISEHEEYLTLHSGVLFLRTGKNVEMIATKQAGIKVEPNSVCRVEYLPGEKLSLEAVGGGASLCARVKLASQRNRTIELSSGEELCVDLKSTELRVEKIAEMPAESRYPQLSESTITGKNAQKPLRVLAEENSLLTVSPEGAVGVFSGKLFFVPDCEQLVQTALGDLYLKADGRAAVEVDKGLMRVQCCGSSGSLLLVNGKTGVSMLCGLETLILDHSATWTEALPADGIGRRAFEVHNIENTSCVISDFHLGSLLCKAAQLSLLRKSENADHKKLREKLLKTAASLQVVTGKHGAYQITKAVAGNPNTEKSKS